jgi:hypothetical protein
MSKSLSEAVWDIEDVLMKIPFTKSKSVWDCIITEIKKKETINYKYIEIVEAEISAYLKKLKKKDKRSIYRETETCKINQDEDEVELYTIDSIEMDLENELLAELIDDAYFEADSDKK